ncbi:MAG: AsmA family protein [Candidatus Sumerlaeia bacterium]|nr:AsmA family protein [Candidatus Sumerlaeia bacterium]
MKTKLLRNVIIGGAVLLILFVIIVTVILANLNSIARVGIEKVLSSVLEVKVNLQKVNIKPLSGKVELLGLTIGNPPGFKTSEAFSVNRIMVKADLMSFKSDQPRIQLIELQSPSITLEQGFKNSNLSQLIKNASDNESKSPPPDTPTASRKKVRIDKIVVEKAQVALSAPILQGKKIPVPLPRIELNNIGGEKKEVSIPEAIKIFLTEIFKTILTAGQTLMPEELFQDLQGSLKSVVGAVGEITRTMIQKTGKVGEQIRDSSKKVEESIKDTTKGIKELLHK